jgi:CheY-like chemotaxis protein
MGVNAKSSSPAPGYYPGPKRILLAVDDPEGLEELASGLREDGHTVVEFEDGSELWDHLTAESAAVRASPGADVIIAELSLPGMDGLQILERLRERGNLTHFILLAWPDEAAVRPAKTGIASFLYEKPVEVRDIRNALFSLTGGSFHEEAAALRKRIESIALGSRFRVL